MSIFDRHGILTIIYKRQLINFPILYLTYIKTEQLLLNECLFLHISHVLQQAIFPKFQNKPGRHQAPDVVMCHKYPMVDSGLYMVS